MAKKKDALVRLYAFILLGQMTTSFLLSTMISHFGERTLMRISAVLLPAILPAAASALCAGHSAVEYLFGAVTPIIYGKIYTIFGSYSLPYCLFNAIIIVGVFSLWTVAVKR